MTTGTSAFDVEQVSRSYNADLETFSDMVQLFQDYYPRELERLETAIAREDCAAVQRSVESLGRIASDFSAQETYAATDAILEYTSVDDLEDAHFSVERLSLELDRLSEDLEATLNSPEGYFI